MKKIYWFFGLSCSGKTTLGKLILKAFQLQFPNQQTAFLDGDISRKFLSNDLGFSVEERIENIKRNAFVAQQLSKHDVRVIACFTTPFKITRDLLKEMFLDNIVLIWCDSSVQKCIQRDVKGLYAQALVGNIKNMIGLDIPFDVPKEEEYSIYIDTDHLSIKECYKHLGDEMKLNIPFS